MGVFLGHGHGVPRVGVFLGHGHGVPGVRVCLCLVVGRHVVAGVLVAARLLGPEHLLDGLLQTALAVDQELPGGHDPLAFLEAFDDLHPPVAGIDAEPDVARLEAPLARRDDRERALARAQDRFLGDGQDVLLGRRVDADVREHVRLQDDAGVGKLEPDPRGAGLGVEEGVDVGDLSLEVLAGQVAELRHAALADRDPGKLVLVHVRVDPDLREVCDGVEPHVRVDFHPLARHQVHHYARARRVERQVLSDLPRLEQATDVALGDVPQLEAALAGLEQRLAALDDVLERAARGGVAVADGLEELLLSRDQLGRVDLEHRLATLDHLAFVLDVELLDPALDLRVDVVDAAFVVVDPPDGAHLAREIPALDGGHPDAHALDQLRVDPDAPAHGRLLARTDRHQIHAHGALPGLVPDVGRVHGRLPVERLGTSGAGARPRGRGGRLGGFARCAAAAGPPAARGRCDDEEDRGDRARPAHRSRSPRLASSAAKAPRRSAVARSRRSCAFSSRTWLSIRLRKSTLSTS